MQDVNIARAQCLTLYYPELLKKLQTGLANINARTLE